MGREDKVIPLEKEEGCLHFISGHALQQEAGLCEMQRVSVPAVDLSTTQKTVVV